MQLSYQQIGVLSDALNRLDGSRVTKIVEGKPVDVFVSYHLAWSARWILAQAQGKLQRALADFQSTRDVLINHHSNGTGQISAAHDNYKVFASEFESLQRQNVNLDIGQITLEQLKLEANEKAGHEIPISILAALQPLIKEPIAATQPA